MVYIDDATLPPTEPDIPIINPKSYNLPLLLISYMLIFRVNRLTGNTMGATIPCQRPAQKPAGFAPGDLNIDLDPAIASGFVMVFLSNASNTT